VCELHAKHVEELMRGARDDEVLGRSAVAVEVVSGVAVAGESFEEARALVQVGHLADRQPSTIVADQTGDLHQAVGLREWERPQQQCVRDAEDGGVRANRQRQGDEEDEGATRSPVERPHRTDEVVSHRCQ
jgi:hypothetical protein